VFVSRLRCTCNKIPLIPRAQGALEGPSTPQPLSLSVTIPVTLHKKSAECAHGVGRDDPRPRWARAERARRPCATSITPSATGGGPRARARATYDGNPLAMCARAAKSMRTGGKRAGQRTCFEEVSGRRATGFIYQKKKIVTENLFIQVVHIYLTKFVCRRSRHCCPPDHISRCAMNINEGL
jgi:hypothetical protein